MSIFIEISLLLLITTVISIVARILKQPLVVGYILTGIIAGPFFLNILSSQHELELFSQVGIVFLLFIVGLHLNPKVIKEVGKVSLVTGLGQVLFTSFVGFGIAMLLGIDRIAALYVAIALTFSSTIIILKLIADKKDLQKLYAKIAIGFLLVQDIVATLILIGVTIFAAEGAANISSTILLTLVKGGGLLLGLFIISHYVLPKLTNFLAQSQELLFLFSLAWGTGLASLFAIMGFSIEIGALIAGVTLSITPFADEMSSRLTPLRDFFIIIFFILLGSQMIIGNLGVILLPALSLSAFVLIGNPVIVVLLMHLLGFKQKTGFMAGLTVAQISEFSLILASLGMQVGHISQETLSLITLVGLITIAGSTYLILYAENIYPRVAKVLKKLDLLKNNKSESGSIGENYTCVIFGYDRVGHNFVDVLEEDDEDYVVIDFNPESIKRLEEQGIPHKFGDAGDVEFLSEMPLTKPRLVISTIPSVETNSLIIKEMHRKNSNVITVVIAHTAKEAHELYELGATYVVIPHHVGAEFVAKLIKKHKFKKTAYHKTRKNHRQKLLKKYNLAAAS